MSYCRLGADSDIEMYQSIYGGFQIYFAREIDIGSSVNAPTRKNALYILHKAKEQGLKVPLSVFDRLGREIMEGRPEPTWDGVYPT